MLPRYLWRLMLPKIRESHNLEASHMHLWFASWCDSLALGLLVGPHTASRRCEGFLFHISASCVRIK
jgi:hypothetical protein